LAGKVAIVTGAASGIGKATARVFAERGASVVVADIRGDGAAAVAAEITDKGHSALAFTADMGEEDQIRAMVAAAVDAFGGLDVLHNNAALLTPEVIGQDQAIVDIDGALFARILGVNLIGPMLAAKYAIPHMLERGGGVVINTTSISGSIAQAQMPMYGASKAGLIGMVRNIATQYSRHGIRAVGISPGGVLGEETRATFPELISMFERHTLTPRLGTPDDVAYLAAFLASDEASYITGVTIDVDGGFSKHFPTYAEEMQHR
jgi:NAD(P)-dependent dehydrogenase (short-subunit alcohol dehydrogenase family)